MIRRFARLIREERGATAIEYGLIVSMIVIAMMAALTTLASETTDMWNFIADEVLGA